MQSRTAPYTNEYLLTTKDGSTWELKSSVASLGDHVGHTVSATGIVENARMHNLKEDAQEAAKDTGITKNNKEHGHMKVTRSEERRVGKECRYRCGAER